MTKQWFPIALLACLAACSDKPAPTPADATPPPVAVPAEPAPATEPAPAATPTVATDASLQAADVDAYLRGMAREVELLKTEFDKIEQARAAGDSDAETHALFAMTGPDIDEAGASAAGMPPARYGFVKNQVDEVQSKLDLLDGLRKMQGDTTAMQAQIGDPYAAIDASVASALKAQQARTAALRAEAIGLRAKAAGG